ncbi:hypothetical protein LHK_01217 [Laribacter hongkongensis HLHK9]|uniref:Uncharacterized protein n=2 Tax=Laribacter hongkongensis TaxID=168471 RepID=C1D6V1_LARHH|nr:hypothetical protein LHK_01217 [Laribacter hongkongensis HLHK9]ASJ24208.1 hypothetical protein LHGZ1_1377 [Laribacter hongkongensis]
MAGQNRCLSRFSFKKVKIRHFVHDFMQVDCQSFRIALGLGHTMRANSPNALLFSRG